MVKRNLFLLILFIFASFKIEANEISLLAGEEELYATLALSRLYELKVKLKLRVSESKVFWQENINWEEEIKNWKWSLEEDKNLPSEIQDMSGLVYKTNLTVIPEGEFLKVVSSGPFILTRNLEIDLEEYPLFSLETEFEDAELITFLGIDYNQDSLIEDYLKIDFPGEYNLLNLAEEKCPEEVEEPQFQLKRITFFFKPLGEDREKNLLFVLKGVNFYNTDSLKIDEQKKFPYPLKEEVKKNAFLRMVRELNPELIRIDDKVFKFNDFILPDKFEDLERDVLLKRIELEKGEHRYEKLQNPTFDIEWAILEPVDSSSVASSSVVSSQEPEITFKKINPTKYLVKVEGANQPFWLVFSESFHKQWRIYRTSEHQNIRTPEFAEIVADYPNLKVKEARHLMRFTPQDIKFLFQKPLPAKHHLVNGYANGWYIEPEKLGLGENFILVIYFFPQSLFYLGLGISGITFLGCIVYLVYDFIKKIKKGG